MNTEVMYMYESVHVPLKVNCAVPIRSSLRYACSYVTYTCTCTFKPIRTLCTKTEVINLLVLF